MSVILYNVLESVATIAINNPPVNALNQSVRQGIIDAMKTANGDNTVQSILLYGMGRTFIAGADITEFGNPPLAPLLPDVCCAIEHAPKSVLAVLHGTPLGGGLEIAMSAHYRIATDTTKMGLPEVLLGIIPGSGGTQRLPRLVGVKNAIDIITTGKRILAQDALNMGLINHIFPTEHDCIQAGLEYIKTHISTAKPKAVCNRAVLHPVPHMQRTHMRQAVVKKARGKTAPVVAFDTILLCQDMDFDTAQQAERQNFLSLQKDPQSLALRHMFKADRASAKIPHISNDTAPKDIKTVAIIGLGTMGSAIAICFANAKFQVIALERHMESLHTGMERIKSLYKTSVKRGAYTQHDADGAFARITPSVDMALLKQADLVLEAVFENMQVKTELLKHIDSHVRNDTVIATNTSYLNVNTLAQTVSYPNRVIGLHFFSPAHIMKLLEIVRPDCVTDTVLVSMVKLAKKIGKIPVVAGVCEGFIGNRMMQTYFRVAENLVENGISPYAVDTAMQQFGFGMGIFAMGDLSGLDIGYAFRRSQDNTRPPHMRYAGLADKVYNMGRLGRKVGKGWYDYSTDKTGTEDPHILDMLNTHRQKKGIVPIEMNITQIQTHILNALINEGAYILSEKIAYRASDIDVSWVRGYGFPDYKGGPMFYADTIGLDKILKYVQQQYKTDIYNWHPAPLLEQLVRQNKTFADYDNQTV